ncbi:MAG: adenylate/guanylate cyclase domain-containing protein [Proteobacteria bacterium]|nr:adenylate/guanylate cyclase domain-containing protein [Pseudomonadota bacterium]MBU1594484.1 adenylate/guanylate cyclase domain-containing protein [Pseudomonadota bacterium]
MPEPRRTLSAKERGLAVGCAVLALYCGLFLAFPNALARLELSLSDLRFRLAARPLAHPDIVHLDIDDASVRMFGKWPLKRSVHAQVLDILTDCGVSLVAYDVVFHGPSSPGGAGEKGEAEDAALEAAIAHNGHVVFPVGVGLVQEPEVVRLTPEADDLPLLPSLLPPGQVHVPALRQAEKTFLPLARLARHCQGLGHVAATPDADGTYRHMPLYVGYHGQLLPSLALTSVLRHLNAKALARPGALDISWPGGSLSVPTDPQGMLPVNLAAPWGNGFWHLSYAEVLESAADPARLAFLRQGLRGKLVVVGLAASGTTDIKATPLSPAEPLVTLHANLVNTILTRSFLRQAPAWASAVFAACFLAIITACFLRLPIRVFLPVSVGLAALCPATALAVYLGTGLALNLTGSALACALFVLALLADGLARTAGESARQRRMLEAYFSPSIARQILESGTDIMEGRGVDLSIMFSDIAGFTAMSDHMEPAEVQRFLGEYLEEMTACIFRHGGAVDKFMGDGIMAFFGYPETPGVDSVENARRSALSAVAASVDMQAALLRLNERWRAQGRQEILARIGVNTGHCVVGDMGSASRREFTLLGRNVNLAQRLESNAPRGGILISARTAALVRDQFNLDQPSFIKVKGFDKEIEVVTVRLPGAGACEA